LRCAGFWFLDAGFWFLDAGCWFLGCWMLVFWMLDAGFWMLDAGFLGCWMQDALIMKHLKQAKQPESSNRHPASRKGRIKMIQEIHQQIFSSLLISTDRLLDEMAILLAMQQLADYSMETGYFEKKYGMSFQDFDRCFQSQESSHEAENDWMDWKFAVETILTAGRCRLLGFWMLWFDFKQHQAASSSIQQHPATSIKTHTEKKSSPRLYIRISRFLYFVSVFL
jgi:hypothetical protein